MKLDVIPLDASIVKGSHGLPAADPQDGPLFLGDGAESGVMPMTELRERVLEALGLSEPEA